MTSTLGSCLRKKAEVSSGCLQIRLILILTLDYLPSYGMGQSYGKGYFDDPSTSKRKGFLPYYGKDRPFHAERLKRDLSSEFKVIAPNCLAMLKPFYYILSHNCFKRATLIHKLKSLSLSSTFSK